MTQNGDTLIPSVSMKDDVIKLIAKQRLIRLMEGARFHKYSTKGHRSKDKYLYFKLSPNQRELHYSDWEDLTKEPSLEELPNRINISDLKGILIGKDCPVTKDGHMKKASVDLAITLIYELDHEECLNFVALDQKTFCYWVDGLNHLLKIDMTSDEFHNDYAVLMEVEMKMKAMDK